MPRIGKLRHRVTIQSPAEAQDAGTGQVTLTWPTFATVWASIEGGGGREFVSAALQQADATDVVEIRYISGVTPRMRIVYGSRTLEILSAQDSDGRRRRLLLMCREAVM